MLVLALIIFVGPLIGGGLSLVAGVQLCRGRSALGPLVIVLTSVLGLLAVWELRYDLGIYLPDLDVLPSGAALEQILFVLTAALFGTLFLAACRWPAATKGHWTAVCAVLFWGIVIGGAVVLSGVVFRH